VADYGRALLEGLTRLPEVPGRKFREIKMAGRYKREIYTG